MLVFRTDDKPLRWEIHKWVYIIMFWLLGCGFWLPSFWLDGFLAFGVMVLASWLPDKLN
jgi:hypothetical protein